LPAIGSNRHGNSIPHFPTFKPQCGDPLAFCGRAVPVHPGGGQYSVCLWGNQAGSGCGIPARNVEIMDSVIFSESIVRFYRTVFLFYCKIPVKLIFHIDICIYIDNNQYQGTFL
jgi:hypothetical protein